MNRIGKSLLAASALAIASAASLGMAVSAAQAEVMVGGAAMLPTKTIPENASQASNLTTLVAAVTAAGLVETLSGPGPFTVFAPTNDAFAKLPAGTVDTLVKPENKATLTGILTYHVVPGTLTAADLMAQAKAGGGTATLTTVQGGTLTVKDDGGKLTITDAAGGTASVETADVTQSNGVVHVIDTVLMPKT
ncbi:fasciclin domain-containing protein [Zavarzinia sp. CC-PAN008]|uniref:fasciclin domain-containing protein n=1 Tax=Zavarzinia sp. CC-PAN008 TaxID=3243332 RepID=UPI003F7487EE